jgi:hypothetical protein
MIFALLAVGTFAAAESAKPRKWASFRIHTPAAAWTPLRHTRLANVI